MMSRVVAGAVLVTLLALWPTVAVAQTPSAQQSMTEVLSFLLTNQSVPTGDFVRDAEAARVTSDTITRSLLVELATLPITASSPGFVYRLNPQLGTMERASDSFGPFFAERSLTAGRGQASFGVSLRLASFRSLDGNDLRDGTFLTSANQFRDEAAPFDVERLTLDLDTRTVTGFANVGITDRFDVGVAVPLVSIDMSGTRINTYRGQVLLQATADAHASGFGDMALRAKYRLLDAGRAGGLAAVAEVRLPTGDEDNLLGAGETAFRLLAVGSIEQGRAGLHVNGGFTRGGLSNELQYRGAGTYSVAPNLTIVGELLGRRLDDIGRIAEARAPHPTFIGVDTIRLVTIGTSTNAASALTGVKWNVTGTWLVNGSVSWPLLDRGLRSGAVAQFGVDYAWSR